jgi:parallel beta-helix repeat protein
MLRVNAGLAGYEIRNITFDGRKATRDLREFCSGYRDYGSNLILRGSGFRVHNIVSTKAMCGSAIEVDGTSFEIDNNSITHNGHEEGTLPGDPWADGVTLLRCEDGYVHNNTLTNNTDVGIVVGGGSNCRVQSCELHCRPFLKRA